MSARRVLAAVLTVALLLALLALLRPIVAPKTEDPQDVDALVALADGSATRARFAVRLRDEGLDVPLVISSPPGSDERQLCPTLHARQPDVVCLEPRPVRTVGEARAVAALAAGRGWDRLAVVTSTPHVTRAGLLLRQCFPGSVAMVDAGWHSDARLPVRSVLEEAVATVAARTVDRAC